MCAAKAAITASPPLYLLHKRTKAMLCRINLFLNDSMGGQGGRGGSGNASTHRPLRRPPLRRELPSVTQFFSVAQHVNFVQGCDTVSQKKRGDPHSKSLCTGAAAVTAVAIINGSCLHCQTPQGTIINLTWILMTFETSAFALLDNSKANLLLLISKLSYLRTKNRGISYVLQEIQLVISHTTLWTLILD